MPSYKDFYAQQSSFVTLKNRESLPDPLTITKTAIEELYNPSSKTKEKVIVAYLKEAPQKLVLSSTRCESIEKAGHGDDYAKWIGLQVSLGEGKTPAGGRMLTITKAVRPAETKAPEQQLNSPPPVASKEPPSNKRQKTIAAYQEALKQAKEVGLPCRPVDVAKTPDGQLSFFRSELLDSIKANSDGELDSGPVKPYAAMAFVRWVVSQAMEADMALGDAVADKEAADATVNELIANAVKRGAEVAHAKAAVAWLCDGVKPNEAEIDGILTLASLGDVDVKTTFEWITKTAEGESGE